MEFSRTLEVLEICIPVFAMLGLGKFLGYKGKISDQHCSFINWLVYTFSLPALILGEVSQQRFASFMDPALVVMPLVGLAAMVVVSMIIAKIAGFKGGFAAAFAFGTFWPNATYVGLPLCQNAFGSEGLAKAAIYNGFVLPFVIITGYSLIGFYGAGDGKQRLGQRIKSAFINPILIAAIIGILIALFAEQFRSEDGQLLLPNSVISTASLTGAFLKMIGQMGLPLALLSIGASLKWEKSKGHFAALSWSVLCKLVMHPLITLSLIHFFYPGTSPVALGVAVILTGTPSAVAMYVVSCQLGVERSFVSSILVLSTALSVLTIPIWVYLVTG